MVIDFIVFIHDVPLITWSDDIIIQTDKFGVDVYRIHTQLTYDQALIRCKNYRNWLKTLIPE